MIKVLLKNRLLGVLNSMMGKNKAGKGQGRAVLFIILYAYLGVAMLFLSTTMSFSLSAILLPAGLDWFYFAAFMLASLTILFVLSIFETKSELFDCKDNDLLLSMPIPEGALVVSRIFVVLITNYAVEAALLAPAIVFYIIFSANPAGIIGGVLAFLLIPLLATALASFVGYVVAYLSKRFKRSSLATLIVSLGFLALYFVGYGALMNGMGNLESGEFNPAKLEKNYAALKLVGDAALLKPVNTLIFVTLSLGTAALAYFLISKNYFKIATDKGNVKKTQYREKTLENRGVLRALTAKELSKFFSSSLYMLNAGLGCVFCVVLSVFAVIERDGISSALNEMFPGADAAGFIAPIMIVAIILLSSMTMMSAAALSLEGKNLWIPKSIPVKDETILLSKLLPQIIVTTPPTLVASVLMIIASGASPVYWAFFILTPISANVCFAILGLIFNVLFPRFDFDNEAQPIKQSMPTFLTMMSQMIFSIISLVINFALALIGLGVLAAVLTFLLLTALAAVLSVILFIPCKRKYSKITV